MNDFFQDPAISVILGIWITGCVISCGIALVYLIDCIYRRVRHLIQNILAPPAAVVPLPIAQ